MKSFLLAWLVMLVLGLFIGCAKTTGSDEANRFAYKSQLQNSANVSKQQNAATVASTMIAPVR